jgi:tetratricopeptide (TPR) repeat protein
MAHAQETPEVLSRQALAWLRDGLVNHAEITFRRVLAARPDDAQALRLHGIALCKLGRPDEGVAEIAAAAEREGGARAWADLAVALRDAGRATDAAAAYAKAAAAQSPGAAAPPPLETQVFCTEIARHEFTIGDYPYHAEIRWGAGRPAHPELTRLIEAGRERYAAFLDQAADLQPDFADVPPGGTYDTDQPFWLNAWFSPLDAIALTAMLRAGRPAQFLEVGSGVSTKYARRAIARYGLPTAITSIDPEPRNAVDRLCDQVIRQPLERTDLSRFEALAPGDVVFLDSSHRSFQGSDVTVFFLEVLPRLRAGVIVHIHDIYLPYDYISGHVPRMWNEQYLLATALLFGRERFEILFPSWFVHEDPGLRAHAEARFRRGAMAELDLYGASFWMRIR